MLPFGGGPIRWYNYKKKKEKERKKEKEQKHGPERVCSVLTTLGYPARPVQLPAITQQENMNHECK